MKTHLLLFNLFVFANTCCVDCLEKIHFTKTSDCQTHAHGGEGDEAGVAAWGVFDSVYADSFVCYRGTLFGVLYRGGAGVESIYGGDADGIVPGE